MSNVYFWDGRQVIVSQAKTLFDVNGEGLNDFPCVDTTCDSPEQRYGVFCETGWESIPFDDFPTAFKAHLLLLSIT